MVQPNYFRKIRNPLLIFGRAFTSFDISINKLFKNYKSKSVLIPPGFACYLQTLDVAINRPIKQFMKKEDTFFSIHNNNIRPPNENEIIEMFLKF